MPAASEAGRTATGNGRSGRLSQEQLDRLIVAHQKFLDGQSGGARAILRNIQCAELDLGGRRLSDADFTGADVRGAVLLNAVAERVSFYCADLRGVDGRGANLRRADLRGASLREACLEGACLDEADLRAAMLSNADGAGRPAGDPARAGGAPHSVDFAECSLKGARMNGAKLKGANFRGANLHRADFKNAQIEGACFDNAVLTGVRIEDMRIDPERLKSCLRDPGAEAKARAAELLERLRLVGVWIRSGGQEGGPAVLDGEDLRPLGKAFVRARLTATSARSVCAVGVNFTGAHLQGARFDGADLRDACFRDADLRGASFAGANLGHARFGGAALGPLSLPNGKVRPVDFTGARMIGVEPPEGFAAQPDASPQNG